MDAHAERPIGAGLDDGKQLDLEPEPFGGLDVLTGDPRDPFPVDIARHDLGAKGDVGQDGSLGGGVVALDVGRRVALRVAQALRLGQRFLVARSGGGHAGQDVVGRAVDDAHDTVDPFAGEGLAQRPDERDAAGHRGLEEQVDPGVAGCVPKLAPVVGEQLLVGGDNGLPAAQRPQHQVTGR